MKPTETDAAANRKYIVLNLLVAALSFTYASAITWAALADPLAEPVFAGVFMIILLSAGLAVNRGAAVVQRVSPSPPLRRAVNVLKWPLTILLPFFLASAVYSAVVIHGMETVKSDLTPVIEYLDEGLETLGAYPERLPAASMAMTATKGFTFFKGGDFYVLSAGGVSIDIDGSTVFYYSMDKRWRRFHNDLTDSDPERLFKTLTDDTAAIRYTLSDGEWEEIER